MNPDSSVGRIMTLDEAMQFYSRCAEAEKTMGKLTREERLVILATLGEDLTADELKDILAEKRTLIIKGKNDETNAQ